MSKTMEERIEEAIVARFFEPGWIATPQFTVDPQGIGRNETVMSQIPAPMTMIAQAIYEQARTQILQKVIERLDIDAIVDEWAPKIAEDVVKQLQIKDGYGWQPHPSKTERGKMMDKVYDMVAEEFGRQCVEHLKNTGGLMGVLEAPK